MLPSTLHCYPAAHGCMLNADANVFTSHLGMWGGGGGNGLGGPGLLGWCVHILIQETLILEINNDGTAADAALKGLR